MLNYGEKGFGAFQVFMLLFLVFNTIIFGLILSLIIYNFKMKKYKEFDTNIYTPGIKSFDFTFNNLDKFEYRPDVSNLGYTGPLSFECYEGVCTQFYDDGDYNDDNRYIDDDDDYDSYFTYYNFFTSKIQDNLNINNITEVKSFSSKESIQYICSESCATIGYCKKCNNMHSYSTSCRHIIDTPNYNKEKYCYAYNLIFKWKKYLFTKINNTNYKQYSYATNAILPNETCPNNYRICGILDVFGHKLCIKNSISCPINNIVSGNLPSDGLNYKKVFFNNLTIYYTNKKQ